MGPATAAARGFCIVFLAAWVGAQVRADFSLLACVFLLQLSRRHLPALCSCMPCPHTPGLAPDCTDADANANGEQDRSEFLYLYVFTHRTTTLRGKLTSWKIKSRPSRFSSPTSRCPIRG